MLYDWLCKHTFTYNTHFVFVPLSFWVKEVFAHFLGKDGNWIVNLEMEKQNFSLNCFVSNILRNEKIFRKYLDVKMIQNIDQLFLFGWDKMT